jgi:hypothetical protein
MAPFMAPFIEALKGLTAFTGFKKHFVYKPPGKNDIPASHIRELQSQNIITTDHSVPTVSMHKNLSTKHNDMLLLVRHSHQELTIYP